MRPVIEKWGPHTDLFLEPDTAAAVLYELLEMADCEYKVTDPLDDGTIGIIVTYGWREGHKFLDYLADTEVQTMVDGVTSEDDLLHPAKMDGIRSLIGNLKALADAWRDWVEDDGTLTIKVDWY